MEKADVLIVDDVSVMRLVLRNILTNQCKYKKHHIYEAKDGKAAIAKYKEEKPEIVFCDISMPDMDGIEVVKSIIEFDPDAKIIMCTASGDFSDVSECMTAGAKDYIVKPPSVNRIIKAVETLTGRVLVAREEEEEEESAKKEEGKAKEENAVKEENAKTEE